MLLINIDDDLNPPLPACQPLPEPFPALNLVHSATSASSSSPFRCNWFGQLSHPGFWDAFPLLCLDLWRFMSDQPQKQRRSTSWYLRVSTDPHVSLKAAGQDLLP